MYEVYQNLTGRATVIYSHESQSLPSPTFECTFHLALNRMKANAKEQRIELGQFIVADPAICHGKPTYKGTRIMVWQVLAMLERGESWDYIRQAWPDRVSDDAIAETIRLARSSLLDKDGRLIKEPAEALAGK
jgi:uncharacterized protein (DUF433 family)